MRRMLIALGCALAVAAVAATSAVAAPGWRDGVIDYSYSINCPSMIFGSPYLEATAGSYAGVYIDPNDLPDAGEVFYVRMTVAGLGNPCAGPYAHMELWLPQDVHLAISSDYPVFCYAQSPSSSTFVRESSCRQNPGAGFKGYTFGAPNGDPWPLPQGGFWQVQVPVYSTKPLKGIAGTRLAGCGDCFVAPIQILDGDSSPFQLPRQYLNVAEAQPGAGFPNPFVTFTATQVTTTAYEFNYFVPGPIAAILTEDVNGDGIAAASEPYLVTPAASATEGDYAVRFEHTWSGLKPNQQYLYELGFQPYGVGDFYVSEPQRFTTPGTFTGGGVGVVDSSSSGTGAPPAPSQTEPPAAQPPAPADSSVTAGLDAIRNGAKPNEALPKDPGPAPPTGEKPALVTIGAPAKIKRAMLLKKGLKVPVRCARACTVALALQISGKVAKRYRLVKRKTSKPVTIGTAKKSLAGAGSATVTVKLSKPARKRLARAKRLTLTLRSTATESGAVPLVARKPIALR